MLNIENIVDLLREAIEEQEWDMVEEVLEKLIKELDNPLDENHNELDW
tara:strand:+ start:269 stop:412 length:144 start_codon:yes stop_codon:yes gene_type:complete